MMTVQPALYPCNSYAEHALITPLIRFHGRIVRTFDELPQNGKLIELIKRVMIAITCPVVYLVLGITAFVGVVHAKCCKVTTTNNEIEIQGTATPINTRNLSGLKGLYQALGGRTAFNAIPTIRNFDGQLNIEEYTSPIMKGFHGEDKVFLIFCYLKRIPHLENQFEVQAEYIDWNPISEKWSGFCQGDPQLNFDAANGIAKGTLLEKMLFDRIKRLKNRQPMGILRHYPQIGNEKPEDKDIFRPHDAYLQGDDLEDFLDEDCLYYEVSPTENASDITLGIVPC